MTKMSQKHFELIQDAIKEARNHWLIGNAIDADSFRFGLKAAAEEIARALATTNPRFDRARFLAACGVAQ